ncbi:hypothetical protein [Cyclobacterium xiamenense]|nr:hypothetical protein [Cyclobacterium xiamenense]
MQYQKTSMLSKKELKKLKKKLPYGYFSQIEKRVNVSKRTISYFFSEKEHRYNLEVHQAALDVIEAYQLSINKIKTRQKTILNEK